MKMYHGYIDSESHCQVIVWSGDVARKLDPRTDLDNHSPTGFAWGYGGSGPAQLALALLADALGDDRRALRLHQEFKREVIAVALPQDRSWRMTDDWIHQAADYLELARANRRQREATP